MKKLLLSILVLMTAATASAQWAVADAPNLAQNVKNFSELQKQVGYLKEQKDRLDETLDMMRKVNSVISSCETAKSIIERQGRLSEKCIDLVTNKKLGTSTLQTLTSSLDLGHAQQHTAHQPVKDHTLHKREDERLRAAGRPAGDRETDHRAGKEGLEGIPDHIPV